MFGSFTKMFVEYNICYRENLNKMLPFREIVHKLLYYFETLFFYAMDFRAAKKFVALNTILQIRLLVNKCLPRA